MKRFHKIFYKKRSAFTEGKGVERFWRTKMLYYRSLKELCSAGQTIGFQDQIMNSFAISAQVLFYLMKCQTLHLLMH